MEVGQVKFLSELVNSGWTKTTRKIFAETIGKKEFKLLSKTYEKIAGEFPLTPKAFVSGSNIKLELSPPNDVFNEIGLHLSEEFKTISGQYPYYAEYLSKKVQEFTSSIKEKMSLTFENKDINLKNIQSSYKKWGEDIENLNIDDILNNFFSRKTEPIVEPLSKRRIGNLAHVKADKSINTFKANETDLKEMYSLWKEKNNHEKMSFEEFLESCSMAENYTIKDANSNTIGFFSTKTDGKIMDIGNLVIKPEYRNSKSSVNAILALRDKAAETARNNNITTLTCDVDATNPKLVGMYERFGFKPINKETITMPISPEKTIVSSKYNLTLDV